MIFTALDVSSSASALSVWEWGEYVSEAFVIVACVGECVAVFGKKRLTEERKELIEKLSTILFIASLSTGLLCLVRTNEISGNVIGSLGSKAEEADGKAKKAITDSSTALCQSKDAAKSARDARIDADQARDDVEILQSLVSGRQIFDTTPIKALHLEGKVVYVVSGDLGEAKSFCNSISLALHAAAGMNAKPSCRSTYAGSETFVHGPSSSESQALANALTKATHFPFTTSVPTDWNIPDNALRVFIGPQPPFVIKPKPTNKQNSHP